MDLEEINSLHPLPSFQINLNQDLADILTVVLAPHILQDWWKDIQKIHDIKIQGHLGALLSLVETQFDKVFVTQLMGFWKLSTVTLQNLDFEITPTINEFSTLTELPIRGRLPMIPSSICTSDFLRLMYLHIFWSLRYVDSGHVKLDYLIQSFGRSEDYYEYQREFDFTRRVWEHMRPIVFFMAFLGVMVLPIRSISFDINIFC